MAQLPPYVPPKAQQRVDPIADRFRSAIQTRGVPAVWEQAAVCPCGRSADALGTGLGFAAPEQLRTTGESRKDCPVCKGLGYLYHSPTPTRVLVTGRSMDPKRFAEQGEVTSGNVGITFFPENPPSFMDRVTLTASASTYRQIHNRGATGVVDILRYPVVKRTLKLATGEVVKGVLYAHKADVSGVAATDGVMVEGTDFVVDTNGHIDWTLGDANGKAPARGARYAMTFFAHPRYVVKSYPFAQRDGMIMHKHPSEVYVELPIRTMAQLEYLGGAINNG